MWRRRMVMRLLELVEALVAVLTLCWLTPDWSYQYIRYLTKKDFYLLFKERQGKR